MKEKPILFSGAMVRAILDGSKTMTRRVIKPQPSNPLSIFSSPYRVGMRLWVRETFCYAKPSGYDSRDDGGLVRYRATDEGEVDAPWKPSIYMPRWASRITLEIKAVRAERVRDISEDDCVAEGLKILQGGIISEFRYLWDSLNAKRGYGWETNPFGWVIEFKRVK